MTSGTEVRGDDPVHLDKALDMPSGLKPSHASLPFARRLMGVLRSVIEVPVLSMSNAGHHNPFCGRIAAQLIRHDHAWLASCRPQQLTKEPQRRKPITLWLDKDINHNPVLIDRSPEIMSNPVDLEKDFIHMPFVASPRTPCSQASGKLSAELVAPAPDRFVAEQHSA